MSSGKSTILIGIVASAGGLEALTELVQNLPKNIRAAYVVAQHMSPSHKSMLPSLLGRETALKVIELEEATVPEAGTIYMTPPNSDVLVKDGMLTIADPSTNAASPKPSGDRLFMSMADEMGSNCAAIVLSGTGSDGSYGIKAVREVGGITIAQDVSSAKYDGMPSAATETGCVDLVLTPAEIGKNLANIIDNPSELDLFRTSEAGTSRLFELLQILLANTRVDFRDYKESTLQRRVQRRMVALGLNEYEDYLSVCRTTPAEVEALYRDLLISVTRFFRDPKQFEALREIIHEMVATHRRPLRVWVSGCATGEEAYSIAAIFAEAMGGPQELVREKLQIFATDIDDAALRVARRGHYPLSAVEDIPEAYFDRYFEFQDNQLVVKRALREVILFSRHNLIQDPPFLNMDLVTLRNVLIYFNGRLQEQVLRRVHYSLNDTGHLFLGTSETVGTLSTSYETVREHDKIYRKRQVAPDNRQAAMRAFAAGHRPPALAGKSQSVIKDNDVHRAMFDAMARALAPNSVLVTPNHDIVRVFGELSEFVEFSQDSRLDLSLHLLKSPLRDEAQNLCNFALRRKQRRLGLRHHWGTKRSKKYVQMEAFPIVAPDINDSYALLSISVGKLSEGAVKEREIDIDSTTVRQLRDELTTTREALQQTIEELQTSNEELQALNVQLQSANEELQATNEEYETSNEELQSTNEELITVNEELQVYSDELKSSTAALKSVLTTAPTPIVVVDTALQVTNASRSACELFNIPEFVGPANHLSHCYVPAGFPSLTEIANETMRMREPQEVRFQIETAFYVLRTVPFLDENSALRGATLILSDVDISEQAGTIQQAGE